MIQRMIRIIHTYIYIYIYVYTHIFGSGSSQISSGLCLLANRPIWNFGAYARIWATLYSNYCKAPEIRPSYSLTLAHMSYSLNS